MILKMQKLLFLGPENKREAVVKKLQEAGVVQIEEYHGEAFEKDDAAVDTSHADKIMHAVKTLHHYEAEDHDIEAPADVSKCNLSELSDEINDLEHHVGLIKEEEAELDLAMRQLQPWGKFSLNDLQKVQESSNSVIQFWSVPAKIYETVEVPDDIHVVLVNSHSQKEFFITIAESELSLENCIEEKIEKDSETINTELVRLGRERHELEDKILSYVPAAESLQKLYFAELNNVNYRKVLASAVQPFDAMLFGLQGWVAKEDYDLVSGIMDEEGATLIEIEADANEKVPTKLENKGVPALGESLVMFYDTPATSDWDPSGWVFLFFVLFFAMIMGDGGYGLTLFALLAIIRIKIGKKAGKSAKRFFGLALTLTFATFIYGTIFSGFYGLVLPIPGGDDLLKDSGIPFIDSILHFRGLEDTGSEKQGILMRVSILIGLVHISLSLFLKALREFSAKQFLTPFANFAWIVIMWVFYHLYSSAHGDLGLLTTYMTTAPFSYAMGISVALVFLCSAGTLHPGKLIAGGLGGLYNGVQFFSDVLSYIRIFALGLSGTLIAQVFNDLGTQVMNIATWTIPLGILVFILGHLLNIGLCLMGAVIHGLRLNFLEYYRWSFDGDGRPFKPFKDLLLNKN